MNTLYSWAVSFFANFIDLSASTWWKLASYPFPNTDVWPQCFSVGELHTAPSCLRQISQCMRFLGSSISQIYENGPELLWTWTFSRITSQALGRHILHMWGVSGVRSHVCPWELDPTKPGQQNGSELGWGLLNQFSPFRYFSIFQNYHNPAYPLDITFIWEQ